MDKVRRTIRRVKTTAEATFDDQLWPINVVLVVMAAFGTFHTGAKLPVQMLKFLFTVRTNNVVS